MMYRDYHALEIADEFDEDEHLEMSIGGETAWLTKSEASDLADHINRALGETA